MLTTERRAFLLSVLQRDGRLVAKSLSRELGLSEDTVRRDLRELASEGLLQRVHGGALPSSPAVKAMRDRWPVSPDSKDVVAKIAAGLVRDGQIVIIDGGTTAVRMARNLATDLRALVVTHSPSVAVELASHATVDVELIGGRLFKHSVVTVGAVASETIARIQADAFFMGVTGVHETLGLTTGDAEEAATKRALRRQAAETFVLTSREKLGAASAFQICPLDKVDGLIVEPSTPEEILSPYRARQIGLISE